MAERMSDEQIRFTVDPSQMDGYLANKGDAIIAALTLRTTAVNIALQAKIQGKLEGQLLKSHTHKLAGSVRTIPTVSDGSKISGGVQAGGGPAFYAKYLEDGSQPHIIRPKDPKGVLAFMVGDKMIFARVVHHPGTKAYLFMKGTLQEERTGIVEQLQSAAKEAAAQ
jgi:hypothetical protein